MNAAAPAARYEFGRADCGSLHVRVAGAAVALRPSGAAWLPAEGVLIAGDLHLEKGSAYAARGQLLPPYDTRETLLRLEAEVAAVEPRVIVLLGDTLHDRGAAARIAHEDALRLFGLSRGRTLIWVVGNHDIAGPGPLPGQGHQRASPSEGLILQSRAATRRPAGRSRGPPAPLRPGSSAMARQRAGGGASLRTGERIILPAFGAYAGGLNIRDAGPMRGLFAHAPLGRGPRQPGACIRSGGAQRGATERLLELAVPPASPAPRFSAGVCGNSSRVRNPSPLASSAAK